MKKKTTTFIMAVSMLLSAFCGCSSGEEDKNEKISVVTTVFTAYDFASNIAGELADVSLLMKAGEETHSYEPTPQDILKISNCDVFVYIGGESEKWVRSVLETIDTEGKQIIALMDSVTLHEEEHNGEGHEQGGSAEYDEHIWTSPVNAMLMTEEITEGLILADKANEQQYKARSEDYLSKLQELDGKIRETVSGARRKTLIFGDRFPFLYFAKEYGLDCHAAFSGCSGESEASASTVSMLINKIKEENIPAVITIEMSTGLIADAICSETGAAKRMLHSCSNVSAKEKERGASYISLMYENVKVLAEVLN